MTPPAGVAAGDFFDLVTFRATGMSANLRTIDKAANNSSVAIELEWRGWRLLFPGDAEEKSWEIMDRENQIKPVHFLKISHHGSKNGSPPAQSRRCSRRNHMMASAAPASSPQASAPIQAYRTAIRWRCSDHARRSFTTRVILLRANFTMWCSRGEQRERRSSLRSAILSEQVPTSGRADPCRNCGGLPH